MHEDGRERTGVLDLITPAAAGELCLQAFPSLGKHTLPPFGMQPLRSLSKHAFRSWLNTEEWVHGRRWHVGV